MRWLFAFALVLLGLSSVAGQEGSVTPDWRHPWRGCARGTWVRYVTRYKSELGPIAQVMTVSLVGTERHRALLKIVASGDESSESEALDLDYLDPTDNDGPEEALVGSETVVVDGVRFNCRIMERRVQEPQRRRALRKVERLWRSDADDATPIKRTVQESRVTTSDDGAVLNEELEARYTECLSKLDVGVVVSGGSFQCRIYDASIDDAKGAVKEMRFWRTKGVPRGVAKRWERFLRSGEEYMQTVDAFELKR